MKSPLRTLLLILLTSSLFITSCSEYQQVVKSDDYYLKFAKAKEYYEDGKYYKALPLFDELTSFFKGTNVMQDILYYYAYCHYETGEYLIAAYHFKSLANTYPNDVRAEECLFMSAKCYNVVSPNYMLEQSYTDQAMEAIQLFVNTYPESKYVSDANLMMDVMRHKLEVKAFYNANLYFQMEKYKAAATAFANLLRDYPDTKDAELAMFLMVKSNYLYAFNSIPSRQKERYEKTITTYQTFASRYSASDFTSEAEDIYEATLKNLDKIKDQQQ